jgi:hypothetical protein
MIFRPFVPKQLKNIGISKYHIPIKKARMTASSFQLIRENLQEFAKFPRFDVTDKSHGRPK